MLMHHSRNTEQKQWDETTMLALTGIARVFRLFLPTIEGLSCFQAAWRHLLNGVIRAATSPNVELANAGVQSAQDLVLSQSNAKGTTPKYPGLWGDVWVMYTTIVQGIHAGESLSTDGKRTVQSLVDSLSEVYARLRPLFSPSDTRKVRRMCLDDPRTLYSKLLNPNPSRT